MGTVGYCFLAYVLVGLVIALFGPEGRKIRKAFREYRDGSPPHYEALGLTTWQPAALWRCVLYFVFTTALAAVFWPAFIPDVLAARRGVRTEGPSVPIDWLVTLTSIEHEAATNVVTDPRLGPDPVPFGFQHSLWKDLVAHFRPGDELWTYSSPAESWEHLAGRAGLALVRNKRVVAHICTLMN